MKKLTRIVLGIVLSVAMVVTGGLAALTMTLSGAISLFSYSKVNASTSSVVTVSEYASAINSKLSGQEGASASYVVDAKPYFVRGENMSSANFDTRTGKGQDLPYVTGIQLTGKEGAIFDLGFLDLNKSSVTSAEEYVSFLNVFPFAHLYYSKNGNQNEIGCIEIFITNVYDSSEFVNVKLTTGSSASELYITAKATNNSEYKADVLSGSQYTFGNVKTTYEVGWDAFDGSIDICYSNGAIYANVTNKDKNTFLLIRNFANDISAYKDGTNHTKWNGFTQKDGKTLVNVKVKLSDLNLNAGQTDSSVIITKLGEHNYEEISAKETELIDIGSITYKDGVANNCKTYISQPATYEMDLSDLSFVTVEPFDTVKLNSEVTLNGAYKVGGFGSVAIDGSVKIYKKGADAQTATTVTMTQSKFTHTFVDGGEYVLEFYDASNALIATSSIICSTTVVPTSVTVAPEFTNGGSFEIWNGTTDVTDGGVAEMGYEIRMYPGKQTYTGLALKDVRTLMFNRVAYAYDTANKQNAENLPFDFVDKGEDSYYTYTISESDSVLFNPSIYFDNYCKITVTDPYKTYEPVYIWTDEQYKLPEAQLNYQAHLTGNSNDGKELFGYIRKDVGKNYETKEVVTRADGFTYSYTNGGLGQIYSQGNAIGKTDVNSADFIQAVKVAYSVVPNMEFEAFYVDINTRFDMKFVMNADGTPNESLSGLRYVVEFNKEDWNKYMYYTMDQANGESTAIFRTYITTQSQYEAAGNDFSKIESVGTNWMTSNWNAVVGNNNKLNLQCLSVNGSTPITATAPGFMYYYFQAKSDIWLDDKYNEKCSTHKAFAITINNLKSNNVTENYLFTTFMANSYLYGSTTGRISTVQQVTVKGLSEELFTKNVLVGSDSAKYDFVDQDGVSYSSEYTMEHVQWLADKAGKGLTFTKA